MQSVPWPRSVSVYRPVMMTKAVKLWQLFSRSLGLPSLLELIWIPCSCSRALLTVFTKQPIIMEQRCLSDVCFQSKTWAVSKIYSKWYGYTSQWYSHVIWIYQWVLFDHEPNNMLASPLNSLWESSEPHIHGGTKVGYFLLYIIMSSFLPRSNIHSNSV